MGENITHGANNPDNYTDPGPVQPWDPNNVTPDNNGGPQLPVGSPPIVPPHVPSNNGDGSETSVDTASMKLYAQNIMQLVPSLNSALSMVQNMKPVAAGGFYQGSAMRSLLTGNSGEGMMQSGFETVLKKLMKSLTDVHDAMLKLATDYDSTEEQNKIDLTTLNRVMSDVTTDINAVASAGSKFGSGQ
jgi:hypothetical protein